MKSLDPLRFEAFDRSGISNHLNHQGNGVFEIPKIDHAARRMDITAGDRDDPGQNPFAGHMNLTCIRAPKERDFVLPRYLGFFRYLLNESDQGWIDNDRFVSDRD